MGLHIAMRVPISVAPTPVTELDEAHSAFRQPSGEQALTAKGVRVLLTDSVQCSDLRWFLVEVNHFGHRQLHAGRQFVALQPRSNFAFGLIVFSKFTVQPSQVLYVFL